MKLGRHRDTTYQIGIYFTQDRVHGRADRTHRMISMIAQPEKRSLLL